MAPSLVWKYFKKTADEKKARCSICTKEMAFCGSTTSLNVHLQKVHNINVTKKRDLLSVNFSDSQTIDVQETSDEESHDETRNQTIDLFFKKTASNECKKNWTGDEPSTSKRCVPLELENPIVKSFQNATAYSRDGEKTAKINDALLYMVAVDSMPFCTVERRGFKKFCKTIQPLYKAPSLKTRENMFQSKYEYLKAKMFSRLSVAKNIVITTDLWTETMHVKTFIGITVHYIDGTNLKSIDIGAKHITGRKTSANLQEVIISICNAWHIDRSQVAAVITDNGSNIVGACKNIFGANKHIRCFAHTLNLVAINSIDFYKADSEANLPEFENSDEEDIEEETAPSELKTIIKKLKQIVSFFKRSEAASTALCEIQNESGKNPKRLIQEVKTRWNSLYAMVERYLELHEYVSRAIRKITTEKSSKSKPPADLLPDEVETLLEVRDVLKPMYLVTQELCAEKNVTISKVIPLIKMLKMNLESFLPLETAASELRRKLLTNIEERFKRVEDNFVLCAATILDPRYKKMHFATESAADLAVSKIATLVQQKFEFARTTVQEPRSKRQKIESDTGNSLWNIHDRMVENSNDQDKESDDTQVELRQYLNRPVCSRSSNPLEVWENFKYIYPHVYEVAREYLGILATSVPCERLFSKAGLIITQRRNRISSEHLDQQLFLQNISEDDWFD